LASNEWRLAQTCPACQITLYSPSPDTLNFTEKIAGGFRSQLDIPRNYFQANVPLTEQTLYLQLKSKTLWYSAGDLNRHALAQKDQKELYFRLFYGAMLIMAGYNRSSFSLEIPLFVSPYLSSLFLGSAVRWIGPTVPVASSRSFLCAVPDDVSADLSNQIPTDPGLSRLPTPSPIPRLPWPALW
jgi:hypothetical protein